MPVESRTLTSDRLTEEAKEEVIDDESNHAEQYPGASKEAIHPGEAGTELPLLFALRQKIYREDILAHAYELAKANQGAPGIDNQSFEEIESGGRQKWLAGLREELCKGTYQPQPVRRVMIPKANGGERPLGIPTLRDRVAQTAAKLVLEPIFEADLEPNAYGYRPKRSAQDAVREVHQLICEGYTDVVDADLSKYFDNIPHAELLQSVARRIADGRVLHLLKRWLKARVEERDEKGNRKLTGGQSKGTPPRWGGQSAIGQLVHEPVSEALAQTREGRAISGAHRQLCGRFRDPQPRKSGGGTSVDAGGDDPAGLDSEGAEDLYPECQARKLRLFGLHLWAALLVGNR
jgi:hypothetical protein